MKMTPIAVVLVSVSSALATAVAIELLRESSGGPQPRSAGERPSEPAGADPLAGLEPLVPATRVLDRPADYEERLVDLERRIALLESGSPPTRVPVTSGVDEPPARAELHDLVLDWIAEEREGRRQAEIAKTEEEQLTEIEFKARRDALLLARGHDLFDWQENKLYELFLEINTREREIGKDMNPLKADPEEFERRWAEFDVWTDRRYIEVLGQDLFDKVFGDED